MRHRPHVPILILAIALGGCDSDGTDTVDSDTNPGLDADSLVLMGLGTCAPPQIVTGEFGVVSTVLGNTVEADRASLDLGGCGSDGDAINPPQDVVQYVVPGQGPTDVAFTLANTGTLVESGDACDPNGLDNRCSTGSCDESTCT